MFQTIQASIDPRLYDVKLDSLRGRACPATSKWLALDASFRQWMDISAPWSKILWLQGIPGAGKTFLAGWVVNRAITQSRRTLYAFASHIFADTTATSIIHTLLFQLASDDPSLQAVLSEANERDLKSNTEFVKVTLKRALQAALDKTFLVIDGLDEVDSFERKQVLFFLLDVLKECPDTRICVSSRMEDDIDKVIGNHATAIRVDHKNESSIRSYVKNRAETWILDSGFEKKTEVELQGLMSAVVAHAKGMFLYARIVIDNVELLTDMDEIRQELRALPQNLEAAYERVFSRLNNLPPAQRDKGRRILGWIGCAPAPLTVNEMEQALAVKHGMEDLPLVGTPVPIVRLCGPIVEIINQAPQFVHFTVKEYIFDSRVTDSLSLSGATADLLQSCLIYLGCPTLHKSATKKAYISHREHRESKKTDVSPLERRIIQGRFRFLHFAATFWLPLVSKYLVLSRGGADAAALGPLLDDFTKERENENFKTPKDGSTQQGAVLSSLLDDWPEASQLFSRAISFQNHPDKDDWTMHNSKTWAKNDPLTIFRSCSMIDGVYRTLPCPSLPHSKDSCICTALERHYGTRLYKCIFLTCTYRRAGFSSPKECEDHINHHNRAYKCRISTCDFAQLGFLNQGDEYEHFNKHHNHTPATYLDSIPQDIDELRLHLFDLIASQQTTKLQEISLLAFHHLASTSQTRYEDFTEMANIAASVGSLPIVRLIIQFLKGEPTVVCNYHWEDLKSLLQSCIRGGNPEVVRYLLSELILCANKRGMWFYIDHTHAMIEIIKSPFLEGGAAMRDVYMELIPQNHQVVDQLFDKGYLLKVASQNPMQEVYFLEIWRALLQTGQVKHRVVDNALVQVGQWGGSLEQARLLIEIGGADVNHRRLASWRHEQEDSQYPKTGRGRTALHWAARNTSGEAARLMKFLMEKGADPELAWAGVKPGQEKGAKEISRHLGMTWEELVDSTKGATLRDPSRYVDGDLEGEASGSEGSESSLDGTMSELE